MTDPQPSMVIPALRYSDAAAAVEWLCTAFGFSRHLVVPGPDGGVVHAQLTLGGGMVMVSSGGHDADYDKLVRPPGDDAVAGAAYVIVEDPDAHLAQAQAAGADIVMAIADQPHGGRLYTCRDPEGHVWSFGDYNPWADNG